MAAVDAREPALVRRLELVVELLVDALADLLGQALGVEPRRHPLHEPHDHPEVLHVRAHRAVDARVLDLDRDLAALHGARAVDLPDRRGGDRVLVELVEELAELALEVLLDDLAHVLEGHLRRGVAQRRELALELLAVLLGDEADVEEAHDLPELHRRALHRPERRDDLLGRLDLPALERALLALVVAPDVRRARPHLLDRLRRRQATHLARAADPAGGDVVLLAGHGPARAWRVARRDANPVEYRSI